MQGYKNFAFHFRVERTSKSLFLLPVAYLTHKSIFLSMSLHPLWTIFLSLLPVPLYMFQSKPWAYLKQQHSSSQTEVFVSAYSPIYLLQLLSSTILPLVKVQIISWTSSPFFLVQFVFTQRHFSNRDNIPTYKTTLTINFSYFSTDPIRLKLRMVFEWWGEKNGQFYHTFVQNYIICYYSFQFT